jgi:hypothetical protein
LPEQQPLPSAGLRFDLGEQQYVTLVAADALGLVGSDFTLEAWIKPQALLNDADLPIIGVDLPSPSAGLQFSVRNARLYGALNESAAVGNTPFQSDVWYHVAFRYTAATGEQVLLVNGVLDAQARGAAWTPSNTSLLIGRSGVQQ